MSDIEEKVSVEVNQMLGLIVLAVRSLNDKQGSSVIEVMNHISLGSFHCHEDSEVFEEACELCARAFLYGVQIGVLLPDRRVKRYSVNKTGQVVAMFLLSLDKKLSPSQSDKPKGPTESFLESLAHAWEGSTLDNDINASPGGEVDIRVFRWQDGSDSESDCEII